MIVSKGGDTDVAKIIVKDTSYFRSKDSNVELSDTAQALSPMISVPLQLPAGVIEAELIEEAEEQTASVTAMMILQLIISFALKGSM